jgi:DNA-binding MarR family transcriptional regulator
LLAGKQIIMAHQTTLTPATLDVETAARLRTAIGRLSRRLRTTASAREAGLSPTVVSVLLGVDRNGPTMLSELAASEGINPTMLSRVASNLVRADLVERSTDDADKRVAWVTATDRGHRLAERIRRERTDAINQAMTALAQNERRQIAKALTGLEALADVLGEHHP